MAKVSFRQHLTRHLIAYTTVICLLFFVVLLDLLYTLEDAFLNERLRELAATIQPTTQLEEVAPNVRFYPENHIPDQHADVFRQLTPGETNERAGADGRHYHFYRSDSGHAFLLVYDATEDLRVTKGINVVLIHMVPLLLLACLLLFLWIKFMVWRLDGRLSNLITAIGSDKGPGRLEQLAQEEPIREFAQLAEGAAEAWRDKLQALDREKDMLRYLSHELRTPLQSAQAAFDVIEDTAGQPAGPLARVKRAMGRLQRVSIAILWMFRESGMKESRPVPVRPMLEELVGEFSLLAEQKGQRISLSFSGDVEVNLLPEVLETLLANLILNAVQHGGAGEIIIDVDKTGVRIANPVIDGVTGGSDRNHGIGLEVISRLAESCGLRVTSEQTNGKYVAVVQVN